MKEHELIQMADIGLSDLINDGGYMQPEMADRFYRQMILAPTMLNSFRSIRMTRPEMVIPKIGFEGRLLQAAKNSDTQNSGPYALGSRAPTRSKPKTGKITLKTSEVIAEIDLPYETLEDVIEGGQIDGTQFQQTIVDMMATLAARDVEEGVINGNTGSGDSYLALYDGLLENITSHVVNNGGDPMSPDLFGNMLKALPIQYLRLINQFNFWAAPTKEIDYRLSVSQRQTALGDATLTGQQPVSVLGVPMKSTGNMPTSNMVLTIPQNVIFGVQRQMRMEFDRNIRERTIEIVLTMRIATAIEEENMCVKATNIG